MVAECLVSDVALIEQRLGMHGGPEPCFHVVRHNHVIAVVNQLIYRVAADISGTA